MPVMAAGAYLHVTFNDVAPGSILATSQHYDQKSERAWRSSYGRQKNTPPPPPWHATPHPLRPSALIEAPNGTFQKQFETRVRWGRRPDRAGHNDVCAPITPTLAQEQKCQSQGPNGTATRPKAEVAPSEDLMREHGVLERVLLIYEAGIRKFELNDDFDPTILVNSAQIVHDFIQEYHEKSEEQHVFPRFKQAGMMIGLIDTLLQQHEVGRRVTQIISRTAPHSRRPGELRRQVVSAMRVFIAMYRPHAAREYTDLFPKLRHLASSNEYDAMAEEFEKEEHRRFGDDGFEKMVERVARLERAIGIHDLNQFTPG
jgi:hemerythrin-like domain-containing protein